MSLNKNQHFVPQHYLRNFAADIKRRQVAVFHIKSKHHVNGASLRSQCAHDHYYGKDDAIDSRLRELEGRAGPAIALVLKNSAPPAVGGKSHMDLLEFALIQRARTPAAAAVNEAMFAQMMRHAPAMPEDPRDTARRRLEFSLKMAGHGVRLLSDMVLKVLYNRTDVGFITSDAPVVFHNVLCADVAAQGTLGYSCSGLMILLPLSTRHMLLFYDSAVYRVGNYKDRVLHVTDPSVIAHLNAMQLNVALNALYYNGANATAQSINEMPLSLHHPRHELVTSVVAREVGGNSELVHFYERPPTVMLACDFVEVKDYYKRIPPLERARLVRPHAEALIKKDHVWSTFQERGPVGKTRTFISVRDQEHDQS